MLLQEQASLQSPPEQSSRGQQLGGQGVGVGVGVGVFVGVIVGVGVFVGVIVGVGVGDPPGVIVGVGDKQKSILSNFDIDAADIPSTAPISTQEILFILVNDAILCYCNPIL